MIKFLRSLFAVEDEPQDRLCEVFKTMNLTRHRAKHDVVSRHYARHKAAYDNSNLHNAQRKTHENNMKYSMHEMLAIEQDINREIGAL